MNRLYELYKTKYANELKQELGVANDMLIPKMVKISINSSVGEATKNSAFIEDVAKIIEAIAGQKPVINKSRLAVAAFKLRQGMDIGVSVTLRGERMWDFFDKLVNVVLPRTKDFRGLEPKNFDGNGNYSFGIIDHSVFPEIDANKVTKLWGFQINIVTSTKDNDHAKALLTKFGFPFKHNG